MPTAELAPKDAQQRVERFVSRFGPGYRRLARHAALPLVLTPELLHYLRNAFLRGQVSWVAEADLLLSDLCEEVGYEQYVMHPAVRARLITELRAEPDGPERIKEVARLLLQYLRRLERAGAGPRRDALPVQQWSALAYLDSDRVSHEVHEALAALVARLQARPNEVNAARRAREHHPKPRPPARPEPRARSPRPRDYRPAHRGGHPSGQQDGQEPHRIQPEDVQPVPRSLVTHFPDQVRLAETVSLLVSLSAEPAQGSALPVALPVGSAIVVVVVPKGGLVLEGKGKGKGRGTLVVSDQQETLPLQFKLRATELGPARLLVLALHQGQSLGMVSWAPTVAVEQGYSLRLMVSVNDVSGIPTAGKSLIIVAAVNSVLHFRIFDGDSKMVVDTDEKGLADQAQQIENLRKQLESLWPPHSLTSSEADRIITAVTSIIKRLGDLALERGEYDQAKRYYHEASELYTQLSPTELSWPETPTSLLWPMADHSGMRKAFAHLLDREAPWRIPADPRLHRDGQEPHHQADAGQRPPDTWPGLWTLRLQRNHGHGCRSAHLCPGSRCAPASRHPPTERRLGHILDELKRRARPTFVVFDTYEAAGEAQDWVEKYLLPSLIRATWLRVVIAGQRVPKFAGAIWAPVACPPLQLVPPSPEDWFKYGKQHRPGLTLAMVETACRLAHNKASLLAQLLAQ